MVAESFQRCKKRITISYGKGYKMVSWYNIYFLKRAILILRIRWFLTEKQFSDKFDQFWAVNRRLMEVPTTVMPTSDGSGETTQISCFKNIPIRLYEGEKSMIQKLVKPTVNVIKTEQKVCEYFHKTSHWPPLRLPIYPLIRN